MQQETLNPDSHALDIARAAQKAVAPDIVILFGSRAAGTTRTWEIIVMANQEDHQTSGARAEQAALEYMSKNPPEMELGIITMTWREFDRCRRVNQHIAGEAVDHGVNTSGERLDYQYNYDDEYPRH